MLCNAENDYEDASENVLSIAFCNHATSAVILRRRIAHMQNPPEKKNLHRVSLLCFQCARVVALLCASERRFGKAFFISRFAIAFFHCISHATLSAAQNRCQTRLAFEDRVDSALRETILRRVFHLKIASITQSAKSFSD